jgi:hypothetical protein
LEIDFGIRFDNEYQEYLINKLERIQNRFLYMLAYKTNNVELILHSLALKFDIDSLEFKRQFNNVCWLYNILNSKIDGSDILTLININVSNVTLRFTSTFYIPNSKRNYCIFAPVN